jgi:hypothetical protein
MAERVGVEPTSPVLPGYPLSRRALSTTQTPLRGGSAILAEARRRGNAGPAKDLTQRTQSSDTEVTENEWRALLAAIPDAKWQECRDSLPILDICRTKPGGQFTLFEANGDQGQDPPGA